MSKWMIYGANGYTGRLIAEEAKKRGLSPILAGRSEVTCRALALSLGLESRIFSCDTVESIGQNLEGISLVLHCAGPFSATSAPMFESCIQAGTHYLDITGEISVFESILSQWQKVRNSGVVAIPGVGFDVVPTDCLAALLKEKMPDATHLTLAFRPSGGISAGTAKTMIEGLHQGGAVRREGKIINVCSGFGVRQITFGKSPQLAVTIGWGDVSTAFYSTDIPNIEVYMASTAQAVRLMKGSRYFKFLLEKSSVQNFLKKAAGRWIKGPSQSERAKGSCVLWGEVVNAQGAIEVKRLRVPEAYSFTVTSALAAVERVLKGTVPPGAWTPSQAFGARFVLELGGVELP